jgi:hypothetical protein
MEKPAPVVQTQPQQTQPVQDAERKDTKLQPTGDYVLDMLQGNRLRLGGIIRSAKRGLVGQVEVLNDEYRLMETFTLHDLRAMGWQVVDRTYGIELLKTVNGKEHRLLARSWPIDPFGRVAEKKSEDEALSSDGVASPAVVSMEKALKIYADIRRMQAGDALN